MSALININFGNSTMSNVSLNSRGTDQVIEWESPTNPEFTFYSLDGVIDNSQQEYIAVNMKIPSFFAGFDRNYNGLFIFRSPENSLVSSIRSKKLALGKYGCPPSLIMDPAPPFFEFNSNYFHPFVLNNLTVGYYVGEKRFHEEWITGLRAGKRQVAVNEPIIYDPLLGLFITRNAQLEPEETRIRYSESTDY